MRANLVTLLEDTVHVFKISHVSYGRSLDGPMLKWHLLDNKSS